MSDTANFDVVEKVNILFKSSMGFPSTKETTPWFQETSIIYNNYVFGEDIFIDEIPNNPVFNNVIQPQDVGLNNNNFTTSSSDWGISEDSTGTIRKYSKLILDAVPNSDNNSYYKLDASNSNILKDSLQFNTKWMLSGPKIYPYILTNETFITSSPDAPDEINQDSTGGNWFFDVKNGVIFFPDYSSSICNNSNNKPVFTFYTYIGRKGITNLNNAIQNDLTLLQNDLSINKYDISNLKLLINDLSSNFKLELNDLSSNFKLELNDLSSNLKLELNDLSSNLKLLLNDLSSNFYSNLEIINNDISINTNEINNINFSNEISYNYLNEKIDLVEDDLNNNITLLENQVTNINSEVSNINSNVNNLGIQINNVTNDLTSKINNVKTEVDTSFSIVNLNIDNIETQLLYNDLSINKLIFDVSKNIFDINELQIIVQDISDDNFLKKITTISNNLYELSSDVFVLNNDIVGLYDLLTDISDHAHDLSFAKILSKLSDLSNIVNINNQNIVKNVIEISNNKSAILENSIIISNNKTAILENSIIISNNKTAILENSIEISNNKSAILENSNEISNNKTAILENSNIISNVKYSIISIIDDISIVKHDILQNKNNILNFDISINSIDNNITLIKNDLNNIVFDLSDFRSDFSNITYTISSDIISINSDLLNVNNLLEELNTKIIDISNRGPGSNNNFSDYYINQIELLTHQNVLIKTDINFNRSLIQNNSIDNQIIKNKINNLDNNIDYINNVLNDICCNPYYVNTDLLINVINDISNSLIELNANVNSENVLFKGDILIANSNIDYNSTRVDLLEEIIENINNKYLDLVHKFNGVLDNSNIYISYNNSNHSIIYNNDSSNVNIYINVDSSNTDSSYIDISNIVFFDSEVLSNLYDENLLVKSDLMLLNSDKIYYQEKINNVENLISNINLSINNLHNKTNNYNINNLYLFYKNLVIRKHNKINILKLDYISTYKNGYYNSLLCNDDSLTFNKLDNLLNNGNIFIEIYCSCFIENMSDSVGDNVNTIKLDMSINNLEDNNYCLTDVNIGNHNLNNKNEYVLLGPITYKLTNNIKDNKSIYYKNIYNFYMSTCKECNIHDIKIIVKILNYS